MDFQQGLITTIHEYGVTKDLLKELNIGLKKRATAILIPCLYEEFERPALRDIKEVLKNLTELNELVIALSAKTLDRISVHIFCNPSLDESPIFLCLWSNKPKSTWAILDVLTFL